MIYSGAGVGGFAGALGVPGGPISPAPEVDPLLRPRGAVSGPGRARPSIRDSLAGGQGRDGRPPFPEPDPPGAGEPPTGPASQGAALRRLQRTAARWFPDDPIRRCGLYPVPTRGSGHVEFTRIECGDGRARSRVGNVQRCGRAACPHCWAGICSERALELQKGVSWWRAQGGRVWLVTLTIRHHQNDSIARFRDAMFGAWSWMLSRRSWRAFREDHALTLDDGARVRVGYARAFEATHGRNGFHPHFHALIATSWETTEDEVRRVVLGGWKHAIGVFLPEHRPSDAGLDVRECDDAMGAAYVSKMGFEVAGSLKEATSAKTSRTMMGLLHAAAEGDRDAGRTWRRYAKATKGVRVLEWSRDSPKNPDSWRRLAGVRETSDEAAARQAERRERERERFVAALPRDVWWQASRHDGLVETIHRATADGSRARVIEAVRATLGDLPADRVRVASRIIRDGSFAVRTRLERARIEHRIEVEYSRESARKRSETNDFERLKHGRKFAPFRAPPAPLRWNHPPP